MLKNDEQLQALAELYAEYMIYPFECYSNSSVVRIFQKNFPQNHYSHDIEVILNKQQHSRMQRGADLPWWGNKFFSETGRRIMIIANDSLSPDAGSVVFYACLMQVLEEYKYSEFIRNYNLTRFISWKKSKELLTKISCLDYLFITDASKVYKRGSWYDGDFDQDKSKLLLQREIEICSPEIILLLGQQPLKVLEFKQRYADVVGSTVLNKNGNKFIVAPFPSNANNWNYEERANKSIKLLHSVIANGHNNNVFTQGCEG